MERYLFICEYGERRSPTAASVAREMIQNSKVDITYGAYSSMKRFEERILPHLQSFSKIFVMEEYMKEGLIGIGVEKEKIFCLDITDDFKRNNPVLINILREKLEGLI
jgi:predicted protein tyrosine phosphatase